MSIFDFCTLPQNVVETLLQSYPPESQKKTNAVVQETAKNMALLGAELALSSVMMAGVAKLGTRAIASKVFQSSFNNLVQDYVDFYDMVKESPVETLKDFGKFLVDHYGGSLIPGGAETLFMSPLLMLLPGLGSNFFDPLQCGFTLGTFAVYPSDSGCEFPTPKLDITTEDVKDVAIEAAKVIIPGLGFIL